jgi:hypothetical protein
MIAFAIVIWQGNKSAPRDFDTSARTTSGQTVAATPTTSAASALRSSVTVTTPTIAAASSPRPAAISPAPPALLSLPALHVEASVEDVTLTGNALGVPTNPAQVGWWVGSAPAGAAAGSTVIDGHVDSKAYGLGALYNLYKLAPGDPVTVTTITGSVVAYRVYARQTYLKSAGLPDDLFVTSSPARLVLITCGGAFDSATGHYESNVVVLANPS